MKTHEIIFPDYSSPYFLKKRLSEYVFAHLDGFLCGQNRVMNAVITEKDIPKWPPVEKGLPCAPQDALLKSQEPLLVALRHAVGETDEVWLDNYWPVIQRYSRWTHLLPASREHHHFGGGGLLRHGLEAAKNAADIYDRHVVGQDMPTEMRRKYRKGMRWAAVIGGLLHDCAKVLTDMEVTGVEGDVWNPIQGSLAAWIESTHEKQYRIRWREKRDGRHHVGAAIMLPRVLGVNGFIWLQNMCGHEALLELMEAIMDDAKPGLLSSIIQEADRLSVVEDLARRGALSEDHRIRSVAAEGHILDAIHSLIRDGKWKPGGKVCMSAPLGELLLMWPKAGKAIGDWLIEHKIPGVVRTPLAIANILVDTGKAVRKDENNIFWQMRTEEGLIVSGLRIKPGIIDIESTPAAGEWVTETSKPPVMQEVSRPQKTPDPPSSAERSETLSRDEEAGEQIVSGISGTENDRQESRLKIQNCDVARAIFEDLANGRKKTASFFWHEGFYYLNYPDAFKGYGMSPMEAAKDMLAEDLILTDSARIAVDIMGKKAVKLSITDHPLEMGDQAMKWLQDWMKAQSDGVLDIKGQRYIERRYFKPWANLFGDPDEVLETLIENGSVKVGEMNSKKYIRLIDEKIDQHQENGSSDE